MRMPSRLLLSLPLAILLGGCVTTQPAKVPESTVERSVALSVADRIKGEESGRQSGRGAGESMAPLYGENSFMVIAPIEFDQLERDMMVAYRDSSGKRIVHRLEFKQGDRWIARGLNNMAKDPEPVTRENLIGVVYAVLNAQAPESDQEVDGAQ